MNNPHQANSECDCPVCDYRLTKETDTVAGELIECRDCGAELEVIGITPFAVEEAPMEDEDWGE